jgi:transposase
MHVQLWFVEYGKARQHARRLIKHLRDYRHEMLTFLDHQGVSPYSNRAEQQMLAAAHARKVQQNRSIQGAKTDAIPFRRAP